MLTKSSYYIETTRVGMNVFNLSMKGERAHAQEKRAAIQKSPVENFTITDKVCSQSMYNTLFIFIVSYLLLPSLSGCML